MATKKPYRTLPGVVQTATGFSLKSPIYGTPAPKPAPVKGVQGSLQQGTVAPQVGSSAPPVDPIYDSTVGALGTRRDQTVAGLLGGRTRKLADYGYNAQFDSSGNPTDLQFDPSNPYSQAALMLRTYQQRQAGNTTSYAARGQLYSGALQNAQNETAFQQGASDDRLKKSLLDFLAGTQSAISGAKADYELGVAGAGADRFRRLP